MLAGIHIRNGLCGRRERSLRSYSDKVAHLQKTRDAGRARWVHANLRETTPETERLLPLLNLLAGDDADCRRERNAAALEIRQDAFPTKTVPDNPRVAKRRRGEQAKAPVGRRDPNSRWVKNVYSSLTSLSSPRDSLCAR